MLLIATTLDESQIEKINEKLRYLADNLSQKISISVTYFCPDQTKQGGAYLTDIGYVKKMDEVEHFIIMDSGMKIEMNQIVSIEEGVFCKTFLHKVAKTFCRSLHLHFVGNCKASCQI